MFTECYCTQFRRSANALSRIYDDELRAVGLKISQFSLLRGLDRLVEASLTEVANEVALDKTTISRNIKILIDAGWVEILPQQDARIKIARLSEAGRCKLRESEVHWRRAQQRVEKEVMPYLNGPADERLLDTLETIQCAAAAIDK
jgi:DNA-binding MarR family transcriptional regulator